MFPLNISPLVINSNIKRSQEYLLCVELNRMLNSPVKIRIFIAVFMSADLSVS